MSLTRNLAHAFLAAILGFTAQVGVAAAHDGSDHSTAGLTATEARQAVDDEALHQRLEDAARQLAPAAVRGECVRRIVVPGQGPSCLGSDGEWLVELADGTEVPTHGGDEVLAGNVMGSPTTAATDAALAAAGPADVSCTSNPRVPHYRLIYSRPSDTADRSGTVLTAFRNQTYKASAVMNEQAQRQAPGVSRKLRVWCNGGVPVIDVVQLPIDSYNDTYATIVSALRNRGYTSPEPQVARYLVYHDGIVGEGDFGFGGQASSTGSTSADPYGPNNASSSVAIDYADAEGVPNWYTLLHETMHTMGAVQNSAPDSNGLGHCRTDHDVMCYAEGGVSTYAACPYLQLDCGDNSYFHAGTPAIGSYLALYWNAAKPTNRYVDHGAQNADYTKPSTPTNLTVSEITFQSATLTWTASIDDTTVTGYRVETSASPFGPFVVNSEAAGTSRTVTGLAPGTTQYVRVRALDGTSVPSDHAQVAISTPTDNTPPGMPPTFTSSGHSDSGFTLQWDAASDDDQVASYLLERFVDGDWTALATVEAANRAYSISGQAANTPFDLSIRARDRAGNLGVRNTHSTSTTADATAPTAPGNLLGSGGIGTASISWSHATDPSGIRNYEVDLSNAFGVVVASVTTANTIRFSVAGGVTYTIRVRAIDAAGNPSGYVHGSVHVSAPSSPLAPAPSQPPANNPPTASPPTTPRDTSRPTRPAMLRAVKRYRTGIRISWRRSTDNVELRGYRIYVVTSTGRWVLRTTLDQPSATAFTIPRLRHNTTYRIGIVAVDTAGNASLRSGVIRTTTLR